MASAPVDTKLRGGYYTPEPLATFLVEWAVRSSEARVLEPSAGAGAFVRAVVPHVAHGHVDAIELFESEAALIREAVGDRAEVTSGDVFAWYEPTRDGTYDAVIGNPPFIRYQTFPESHRTGGFALMHRAGLRPNRLTNAWVPFVVLATMALKPGGRLAMVLPAELLQVTYAGELREFLARTYSDLKVITFRKLVFAGIQQETVLLMGTRADGDAVAEMSFLELDSEDDLTMGTVATTERVRADLDHGREKWTQYYLSRSELGLIRELERSDTLTALGSVADVDVGIVTGRNEFFVLTPSRADELGLTEWCVPLVGRSAQLPGVVLRPEEWEALAEADGRCLLLQLGRTPREALTDQALDYVRAGESAGHHRGYKCRIRLPEWWYVPSVSVPDAFLLRQIHDGPRIIVNRARATCTDTIHRVRALDGVDPEWLAAASMNSVTFAFSEIRGRSYGGGVLELEPNEAEGLPFPRPAGSLPVDDLDLCARRKDADQILDEVDHLVLAGCGLTADEVAKVRGIWRKLSSRRRDRKRR